MAAAKQPPTVPVKTGGGGDDGEDDGRVLPALSNPEAPSELIKQRKQLIEHEDFEFSPGSLVGSWFHRLENDRMVWQGAVVAEPQPGVYLLQVDRLGPGAEQVQRLVKLEQLVNDEDGYDWRFYDTENEARSAYAKWVATERERV